MKLNELIRVKPLAQRRAQSRCSIHGRLYYFCYFNDHLLIFYHACIEFYNCIVTEIILNYTCDNIIEIIQFYVFLSIHYYIVKNS